MWKCPSSSLFKQLFHYSSPPFFFWVRLGFSLGDGEEKKEGDLLRGTTLSSEIRTKTRMTYKVEDRVIGNTRPFVTECVWNNIHKTVNLDILSHNMDLRLLLYSECLLFIEREPCIDS